MWHLGWSEGAWGEGDESPVFAASGTSTALGAGASFSAAPGTAAGTSSPTALSPPGVEIGVGRIVQRLFSVNPPVGTLSTWDTDMVVSSIDTGTDTLTSTGHGLTLDTLPGPFYATTTGVFPTGMDGATRYWCVVPTANTFQIATSMQNARTGTVVNLTTSGSGTLTFTRVIATRASVTVLIAGVARGVWSTDGTAPFDNKGNTYTDRDDEFAYVSFPGARVRMVADVSGAGGPAHTVSATWGDLGGSGDEVTAIMVEVIGGTLIKQFAHSEVAIGSTTITAPALTSNAPAVFVYFLWGNGPVLQDHTWTAVDGNWVKHVEASAEADTHANGYIQCTVFSRRYSTAQTNIAPQFQGVLQEGAQFFGYVVQSIDLYESVGAASGTSTVSAAGAQLASAAGSAAGASTVAAVAAASAGVGDAAGTGSATAVGTAITSASGAAAGSSTPTGIGAALAASPAVAGGTSTPAAVGASVATASGAAAGTSGVAAAGASAAATAGTASGTSPTTAAGTASSTAAGSAAGTSTPAGVGATTASGLAASAGTSTASGVGAAAVAAVGSAAGAGSASSTATSQAAGTAAGTSSTLGAGAANSAAAGAASGSSTAAAAGGALIGTEGSAAGTSGAIGSGAAVASSAGASSGTSSAAAAGGAVVAAAGTAAGTSTAMGTAPPAALVPLPSDLEVLTVGNMTFFVSAIGARAFTVAPALGDLPFALVEV